jgi:hypothetical protein
MTDQDLDLEIKSSNNDSHDEAPPCSTITASVNLESNEIQQEVDDSCDLSSLRVDPIDIVETKVPVNEKPSTFTQLVKGWESYISASNETRSFQPLQQPMQMFQGFGFRGQTSNGPPPLPSSSAPSLPPLYYAPFGAPALRHTHSTPNQFTPSMVNFEEPCPEAKPQHEILPPPVPLDPFLRSNSTPSAYRKLPEPATSFVKSDSSAFSLAPQRMSYTGQLYSNPYSAFNPVKYYELALEDMERTSIEVTDTTMRFNEYSESVNVVGDSNGMLSSELDSVFESSGITGKRGAAFRAARFLSDVRTLRRKRRFRTGRENPVQPVDETTVSANDDATIAPIQPLKLEAAVTIVTEPDWQTGNIPVAMNSRGTNDDVVGSFDSVQQNNSNISENDECKDDKLDDGGQYLQLDSDVDEEDDLFRRIDAQLHVESPCTIPSPSYQNFVDEHPSASLDESHENSISAPSIKFLESQAEPIGSALQVTFDTVVARSPSPTRMDYCDGTNLTPRSQESFSISPGTTRSTGTGSSSGQTTHATSNSSTGQQSGLSTISETDREVMETNKEAKRRRGLDGLRSKRKSENDATSFNSSSTQSTNPHGYIALGESPVTLREGANVPVERFFSNTPSLSGEQLSHMNPFITSTAMSNARRGIGTTSPSVTSETVSATNTSSSTYSEGEPPTFVSYIESNKGADLGRYLDASEGQSERSEGGDAREPSPAPSEVAGTTNYDIFDEPKVARELRVRRLQKYRTRSMRSPRFAPSRLAKTPPPPQSLMRSTSPNIPQPISPPRKLVDHPVSSISRPNVIRSGGVTTFSNLHYSAPVVQQFHSPILSISETSEVVTQPFLVRPKIDLTSGQSLLRSATYNERNIEVVQSDSIDEAAVKIITPEKDD